MDYNSKLESEYSLAIGRAAAMTDSPRRHAALSLIVRYLEAKQQADGIRYESEMAVELAYKYAGELLDAASEFIEGNTEKVVRRDPVVERFLYAKLTRADVRMLRRVSDSLIRCGGISENGAIDASRALNELADRCDFEGK